MLWIVQIFVFNVVVFQDHCLLTWLFGSLMQLVNHQPFDMVVWLPYAAGVPQMIVWGFFISDAMLTYQPSLCIPLFGSLISGDPCSPVTVIPCLKEFPSFFLRNPAPPSFPPQGQFLENSLPWGIPSFGTFPPKCPNSGSFMAKGSRGNKNRALILLG